MSQNYENVALTEDDYVIFLERTDYVNAQRRYGEWQCKESSKTIEINIPCDSHAKKENLAVILQLIIHSESIPSNVEIDIVYAYQTAIYLQSNLKDQLLSCFVNDDNCTKLMIETSHFTSNYNSLTWNEISLCRKKRFWQPLFLIRQNRK